MLLNTTGEPPQQRVQLGTSIAPPVAMSAPPLARKGPIAQVDSWGSERLSNLPEVPQLVSRKPAVTVNLGLLSLSRSFHETRPPSRTSLGIPNTPSSPREGINRDPSLDPPSDTLACSGTLRWRGVGDPASGSRTGGRREFWKRSHPHAHHLDRRRKGVRNSSESFQNRSFRAGKCPAWPRSTIAPPSHGARDVASLSQVSWICLVRLIPPTTQNHPRNSEVLGDPRPTR